MNPGPGVELLLLRSGERLTVSGKGGEALYDRLEQGDEEPNDSDSVCIHEICSQRGRQE